jgi:hypothetical protein
MPPMIALSCQSSDADTESTYCRCTRARRHDCDETDWFDGTRHGEVSEKASKQMSCVRETRFIATAI